MSFLALFQSAEVGGAAIGKASFALRIGAGIGKASFALRIGAAIGKASFGLRIGAYLAKQALHSELGRGLAKQALDSTHHLFWALRFPTPLDPLPTKVYNSG